MLTFLNQPLLWGLGLVAVPVVIHLINMMRHRRVKWAAMEFLLASQKKHSTWIRLKELLLLLLRMAAIAAIVLIVARPRLDGGLGKQFGDATTHHIVLLDDTFSMSDRFAERNVFAAAKEAVEQIALRALDESSAQTFTLLRASRAGQTGGALPDVFAEPVNSELVMRGQDRKLNSLLAPLEPSDLAAGPDALLKGISSLLKPSDAEERIIYLISDFRAKDWHESSELQSRLAAIEKKSSQTYFINAADAERPNLGVTSLRPASGMVAAGIQYFMHAHVRNFGRGSVDKVAVSIRADGDSGGTVFIEKIEPGRTEVARFPVFFSTPGEHTISVSLEPDAVEADNHRFAAMDVPASVPVLVVDGDPNAATGRAVAELALAPPGPISSGLAPKLQPPNFLNDPEKNPLTEYRTAFLCNIDRLEEAAIRNLEMFVESGGGVCFIVGDRTVPAFFNDRLYRDGAGLFPVPLDVERPLFRPTADQKTPDIVGTAHPVFKIFTVEQNSDIYDVTIDKYYGIRGEWTTELGAKQRTDVVATLRNGAPLAVEKTFGKGRVTALLTLPVEPQSNWMRKFSFVVTMLELQSHLAPYGDSGGDDRRVGTPLVLVGDATIYRAEAQILPPETSVGGAVSLQAVAEPEGLKWTFPDTFAAGFYRVEQSKLDDTISVRNIALNVDPGEGELTRFEENDLREQLGAVRFVYRTAGRFLPADSESGSTHVSTMLLYLLAAVLLGEQALAYAVSYHPPRVVGAPA